MTDVQVAQLPTVEIRRRSPAQEVTAHAALLDCGYAISPRLEDTAPDTMVLDLAGLKHLFNSPEIIARNLAQRTSELGLEAHIAVAPNPEAALHAARGFPGITLICPGEEAERLDPLPVSVLAPPPDILETLDRWGVRTFKALDNLPIGPISERLGQEGVRLQKLARGTSLRPLVPAEAALNFEEVMELEHSVALLEPLSFILGRLLNQLCARLTARSLATNQLRLQLELEDQVSGVRCQVSGAEHNGPPTPDSGLRTPDKPARKKVYERTLRLPVPMRDPKVFLKLLQLNLQADPPQAPILKVTIAAEPARPRVTQGGLFLPLAPDPEKLEVVLARISNLVGEGNVGSPELVDTHRPGAFRMCRFNPSGSKLETRNSKLETHQSKIQNPKSKIALMALRGFCPPLPARVQVRAGRPMRVSFRGVRGEVVSASGPWRTSGDWWREDGWEQEEWDVALQNSSVVRGPWSFAESRIETGNSKFGTDLRVSSFEFRVSNPQRTTDHGPRTTLYRIYRDLASGNWFIRGMYD